MRKKLYRNLTTLVLTFALAMGTLIGTTMDVMAANNYGVDITASPDDIQKAIGSITFKSGDIITGQNLLQKTDIIKIYLRNDSTSYDYDSMYSDDNISKPFPEEITLGGKTYKNPEWRLGALDFPVSNVLKLYFDVCTEAEPDSTPEENPDPNPEEKPDSAPEEKPGTAAVSKASTPNSYVPSHECSFQWVTTVDPQPNADGLEEYMCTGCGAVQEQKSIPASMASVKNLFGFVNNVPENGTVTTDFGRLHTISDYLLKKMAERNDATVTIQFEYKNQKLQITFPAGTDYTPVLTDTDTMYGFYGVAAKLGLTVTERQ